MQSGETNCVTKSLHCSTEHAFIVAPHRDDKRRQRDQAKKEKRGRDDEIFRLTRVKERREGRRECHSCVVYCMSKPHLLRFLCGVLHE